MIGMLPLTEFFPTKQNRIKTDIRNRMALNKAITHSKEHRRHYRKSKAWDSSCRNHGSCSYCESNRRHADHKARARLTGQVREWHEEKISKKGLPDDAI